MHIRSMTGYGRSERSDARCKLVVELKSVNHRYFDLNIKMPKIFYRFESYIRSILKQYIERGKVDLYISYENYESGNNVLRYHADTAASYLQYCKEIGDAFGIPNDIKASSLVCFPDVITAEEESPDESHLKEVLSLGLSEACEMFTRAREEEGENLKKDLLKKLAEMEISLKRIEERAPLILKAYRNTLRERILEVLSDASLDESRIALELAIYADKVCVDEEMVRLHSHMDATARALTEGGAMGRKLDFIAQEMNREANTTLSKSTDLTLSEHAIFLKTTIEKIREQVQNIE